MLPKLIFDNKNSFVDITDDRTRVKYNEIEEIGCHKFRHVKYGIFVADPMFNMTYKDILSTLGEYKNVSFVVEDDYEAISKGLPLNVIFAFYNVDNTHRVVNYLNRAKDEEFTKYYSEDIRLASVTSRSEGDKMAFNPIFNPTYDKSVVKVQDHIGFKIEPGIYYFPLCGEGIIDYMWRLPTTGLMSYFPGEAKVAGICHYTGYRPSFDVALEYLAVGEEHFDRLKQIQEKLGDGFYHEFSSEIDYEDSTDTGPFSMESIEEEQNEADNITIVEDAIELVEGLGFKDLEIRIERPLFESEGFKEYAAAYRLNDNVVLISKCEDGYKTESHSLRFISGLYVRKDTTLNNGFVYPVVHTVVDCREDRLKEILTPEAYELYLQELQ